MTFEEYKTQYLAIFRSMLSSPEALLKAIELRYDKKLETVEAFNRLFDQFGGFTQEGLNYIVLAKNLTRITLNTSTVDLPKSGGSPAYKKTIFKSRFTPRDAFLMDALHFETASRLCFIFSDSDNNIKNRYQQLIHDKLFDGALEPFQARNHPTFKIQQSDENANNDESDQQIILITIKENQLQCQYQGRITCIPSPLELRSSAEELYQNEHIISFMYPYILQANGILGEYTPLFTIGDNIQYQSFLNALESMEAPKEESSENTGENLTDKEKHRSLNNLFFNPKSDLVGITACTSAPAGTFLAAITTTCFIAGALVNAPLALSLIIFAGALVGFSLLLTASYCYTHLEERISSSCN